MKRILAFFTITLSLLMLWGCSTVTSPGTVLLEATLADKLLQSGIVQTHVVSVELSETELETLISSLDTYREFREKWASVVDAPETIPINLIQISHDYVQIYDAFVDVKDGVVLPHWNEYSTADKIHLHSYLARAQIIDRAVNELLAARQANQAASKLLELASLAAQIAGIY